MIGGQRVPIPQFDIAALDAPMRPPTPNPSAPSTPAGLFDDLIPAQPQAAPIKAAPVSAPQNLFDDLIPPEKFGPKSSLSNEQYGPTAPAPGYLNIIKEALTRGIADNVVKAYQGGQATRQAAAGQSVNPLNVALPNDTMAQYTTEPLKFGWPNLKKIIGKTLFGLSSSAPELAGGIAGGVGGTAIVGGPENPAALITAPVGAGVGAAAVHEVKSLAPIFADELQKNNGNNEAAWQATKTRAGIESAGTGASFALFGVNPFENEVKNLLFQTFAAQPAVGAAQQVASNVSEGKPALQGTPEAAFEAGAGTATPLIAHHAVKMITGGGKEAPTAEAPQPAAPPEQPAPQEPPAPGEQFGPQFAENPQKPPENVQNVQNAPLVENPSAPPLQNTPAEIKPAEPPAPEPLKPQEPPIPEQPAAAPPAPVEPPGQENPATNEIKPEIPEVNPATDQVNNETPPVKAPADIAGTQLADQVKEQANITEKPQQYSNFFDEHTTDNVKYLENEFGKIHERDGKADPNISRVIEGDDVLQEISQKAQEYGVPDITQTRIRDINEQPHLADLYKKAIDVRNKTAQLADIYRRHLSGEKVNPDVVKERYEKLNKSVTDAHAFLDDLAKPAGEAAPKPKSKSKGVQTQAAKDESIRQLRTIRDAARAQIKAGDEKYTGPREAVMESASGAKTRFSPIGDRPQEILGSVDTAIKRFSARPRQVFYSKTPDQSALPEAAPRDESIPQKGDGVEAPGNDNKSESAPAEESKGPPGGTKKEPRDAPYKQRLLSQRRGIWREAGIDPAVGENMPTLKQFEVAKDIFAKKYGIDIELAKKADMAAALSNVKDLYVELQTMAAVSKLPESAIGLKGVRMSDVGAPEKRQLKLVFKADRPGGHLGVYIPDANEIHQPGRARSVAHEWAHALDYYILSAMGKTTDGLGKNFRGYTSKIRREGGDYSPSTVSEAWVDLLNTMFFDHSFGAAKIMELETKIARTSAPAAIEALQKQIEKVKSGNYLGNDYRSNYFSAAKSIPAGADKGYWTRPTELWARAYEAYVSHEAQKAGAATDIVSARPDAYFKDSIKGNPFEVMYPQGEDRFRIFNAIDNLMDRIARSDILQTGSLDPAKLPTDADFSDPLRWFKHMPGYEEPTKSVKEAMLGTPEDRAELRRTSMQMMGFLRDGRPHNPVSWLRASNNAFMTMFSAMGRQLRVIEARYADKPSPTLTKMINGIYGDPGKGRYTGARYDQLESNFRDKYLNRLAKIIDVTGLKRHDKVQMNSLRDLLLGVDDGANLGKNKAKLLQAAEGMREIWNESYADMRENYGVDIGYIKDEHTNYINRIEDLAYINAHPQESIKEFKKAYVLKYEDEQSRGELNLPKNFNIDEQAQRDAENYVSALIAGDQNDLGFTPPSSKITKRRTFPGSADTVLKNVRVQNPIEALESYIANGASRSAWTKIFEPEPGAFDQSFKDMVSEGVTGADIKMARDIILSSTGRRRKTGVLAAAGRPIDALNAVLTMTMLARAPFASLSEFSASGFRTGDFRDSIDIWHKGIQELWNKADSKDREDVLQAYGIISNNLYSMAVAEREGGSYADAPNIQRMQANFFHRNLMTPITEYQRKVATRLGQSYFLRMANAAIDPHEKSSNQNYARAEMREIGIPENKIDEFAKYLIDRDGALPDLESASAAPEDFNQHYARALTQFSWDVIQHPKTINRSYASNTAVGKFAFGFLSFTTGFYENLTKRATKVMVEKYKQDGLVPAAEYFATGVLAPYAVYFATSTAAFALRTMLFNRNDFNRKTDDEKLKYLLAGGFAYTSPAGPLADILYNTALRVKYDQSLANTFIGKLGYIIDILDTFIHYWTRNSKSSDTTDRKSLQALYALTVMPALSVGSAVAPVPGGPGTVLGLANMWAGSRDAQEDLTNSVFGEQKDRKAAAEASGARASGGSRTVDNAPR